MSSVVQLPKTMRSVMCHGPWDYRLEEVATPQADAGEVVIKVQTCGVCASDMKCYTGAPLFWGDEHRKPYVDGPVIAGHEFIGEVVQLGAGTSDDSKGRNICRIQRDARTGHRGLDNYW